MTLTEYRKLEEEVIEDYRGKIIANEELFNDVGNPERSLQRLYNPQFLKRGYIQSDSFEGANLADVEDIIADFKERCEDLKDLPGFYTNYETEGYSDGDGGLDIDFTGLVAGYYEPVSFSNRVAMERVRTHMQDLLYAQQTNRTKQYLRPQLFDEFRAGKITYDELSARVYPDA